MPKPVWPLEALAGASWFTEDRTVKSKLVKAAEFAVITAVAAHPCVEWRRLEDSVRGLFRARGIPWEGFHLAQSLRRLEARAKVVNVKHPDGHPRWAIHPAEEAAYRERVARRDAWHAEHRAG